MKSNSITKSLVKYFLQGLLVSAPLVLTIWVLYSVLEWVDGLLPIKKPGLGILALLVSITFLGFLANTIVIQPLLKLIDKTLTRIPLTSIIYNSIKDLVGAFVGDDKKFDRPVMAKLSENTYKLGFVTIENLGTELDPENKLMGVYFPHSYNFSGELMLIPRNNIEFINHISAADVMKLIVSGGVSGNIKNND
ncbi:MAG: hypothetical protein RLZZ175_2804 [Bacteroidota bacterium]|jgi:uncharacterized membrane protein